MIKVLMTLPVKIGFDGMSKQVLSYGKYMDKSDVIIDLVSCRGFDPKMKSNVDEANFHNIYRLEYRDTNQIKYFLDLYKIMKKEKYEEDFNIIAPCLMDAKAISMLKVEGAAYCYRKVESSMLHGYDRNMSNSIYHIYPILLKACKSKNMGGFVRQIQFEYVSAVVRLFLNETKNSEGYINMSRIIKKYLTDRLFQQSLEIVDARMYPVKFRIILYFLKHYDSFMSKIIIKLICLIRRQGINHA